MASAYPYQASETVGFAVVLHEITGTTGNFTLYANRTMGLLLSVEFCLPSCAHPVETATVDFHAWETVRAVLNLTTAGTVNLSGSPAAAVALRSSAVSISAGVRENASVTDLGTLVHYRNVTAVLNANASTLFDPSLGLLPLQLSPGESWTSNSTVLETVTGAWSVSVRTLHLSPVIESGPISLSKSANVTLDGAFGGTTVRLAGSTYDVLTLTFTGPFSVREGFLLIPSDVDLFGGTGPSGLASAANTSSSASFSEENVDVSTTPGSGSHVGFDASYVVWRSGSTNPASDEVEEALSGVAPATLAPQVASPGASASNATYQQGVPETVAQATTDQTCLATGFGCPASGGPRSLAQVLLIGAIAAVAAVIAVVVVAERRRLPPPAYPNAALYPPGPAAPGAPGGVRRPQAPPPPAEDDPLGHLW